ncbi:MAG: hypothetical protein JOZ56_03140 [Actinobacteria bacterium]|nr:hypothetical protein [Actinomycetota bacterium]MBV8562063.1 hypothetical protein [Actinomycetota bacterium]
MVEWRAFVRNPFSFLFARSTAEERVAEYVVREHRGGRALNDILQDNYVQNRLSPQQQMRMLERPEIVDAVSHDDLEQAHIYLQSVGG